MMTTRGRYAPWRAPPLRLVYLTTVFYFGYIVTNLYAQKTPEQTAIEFVLVSFFRWANEAALLPRAMGPHPQLVGPRPMVTWQVG